jgi:hypothetical protein
VSKTIATRLKRLEQQCGQRRVANPEHTPPPLTDDERRERLRELLAYDGPDPELRYRQERAIELLRRIRERRAASDPGRCASSV